MCHFINFSPLINIKLCRSPFQWRETPTLVSVHGDMTSRSPSGLVCTCSSFHSQNLKLSKRLEATTADDSPHFSIGGFWSLSLILLVQPQSTHCLGAHSAAGPSRRATAEAQQAYWKPSQLVSSPVSTYYFQFLKCF